MWVYYIIGGILCFVGIFMIVKSNKYFNETTTGIIVSIDSNEKGEKGKGGLSPTYEYNIDGHTYRKQIDSDVYYLKRSVIGQEDKIKYNSEDPENIMVVKGIFPYFYYAIFIIMGTLTIVLNALKISPIFK